MTEPWFPSTLKGLKAMFESASAEELRDFCMGALNALIVVEAIFERRFPKEFAEWDAATGGRSDGED